MSGSEKSTRRSQANVEKDVRGVAEELLAVPGLSLVHAGDLISQVFIPASNDDSINIIQRARYLYFSPS